MRAPAISTKKPADEKKTSLPAKDEEKKSLRTDPEKFQKNHQEAVNRDRDAIIFYNFTKEMVRSQRKSQGVRSTKDIQAFTNHDVLYAYRKLKTRVGEEKAMMAMREVVGEEVSASFDEGTSTPEKVLSKDFNLVPDQILSNAEASYRTSPEIGAPDRTKRPNPEEAEQPMSGEDAAVAVQQEAEQAEADYQKRVARLAHHYGLKPEVLENVMSANGVDPFSFELPGDIATSPRVESDAAREEAAEKDMVMAATGELEGPPRLPNSYAPSGDDRGGVEAPPSMIAAEEEAMMQAQQMGPQPMPGAPVIMPPFTGGLIQQSQPQFVGGPGGPGAPIMPMQQVQQGPMPIQYLPPTAGAPFGMDQLQPRNGPNQPQS